jgi:hypothetical protein
MNTQAKVAIEKQSHPERFCPHPRCLWRTAKLNHETQKHEGGGFCPRHQLNPRLNNLAYLTAAEKDLAPGDKHSMAMYLLGSLSMQLSEEKWRESVDLARRLAVRQ